jgi:hypothetical protein
LYFLRARSIYLKVSVLHFLSVYSIILDKISLLSPISPLNLICSFFILYAFNPFSNIISSTFILDCSTIISFFYIIYENSLNYDSVFFILFSKIPKLFWIIAKISLFFWIYSALSYSWIYSWLLKLFFICYF